MFFTRLISGIALLLIAIVTIVTGGDLLFALLLIISIIGLMEFYGALKMKRTLLSAAGYLVTICYYLLIKFELFDYYQLLMLGFVILLMGIYVFTFPKYKTEEITAGFFGVFYVSVMLSYIYQTRMLTDGAYIVWLIFLSSWGCDTCAYATGMLFGKHKLAPRLSPKKSIEGAIGGIIGASILGGIYAAVFSSKLTAIDSQIIGYAIICGIGSVIAQIGDLAASAIKRNHNLKDYGKLIPGHGGILDRFDSVIFTAPAIYFLAAVFI